MLEKSNAKQFLEKKHAEINDRSLKEVRNGI